MKAPAPVYLINTTWVKLSRMSVGSCTSYALSIGPWLVAVTFSRA